MRSSVISLEGMVTLKLHALQWRRFLGRNPILFGSGRWFWKMFVDLEIGNSEIRFMREHCIRPSQEFVEVIPPDKTRIDLDPPQVCVNMMHSPQIPCPNKIFSPSKAHLGNDFGLWSAQLALPWWCPDPCCGMWRSLSATVDPQRSEIQDGRVVPWAFWLGSSVVCAILVTYGFVMAFAIQSY